MKLSEKIYAISDKLLYNKEEITKGNKTKEEEIDDIVMSLRFLSIRLEDIEKGGD